MPFRCNACACNKIGLSNGGAAPDLQAQELTLSAGVSVHIGPSEDAVNIITFIVVGILAGWLAERITGRNHELLKNLIVGVVGAFVGGFLIGRLLITTQKRFDTSSIELRSARCVCCWHFSAVSRDDLPPSRCF